MPRILSSLPFGASLRRPLGDAGVTAAGRGIRRAAVAVLSLAVVAYLSLGLTALLPNVQELIEQLMLAAVLAVSLAVALACGIRTSGFEHKFWMRMGIILGLLAAAEIYVVWYLAVIDPGGPQPLALDTGLRLAAAAVFVWLALTLSDAADGTAPAAIRSILDVVTAALTGTVLLHVFVVGPLFAAYRLPGSAKVTGAVYAVLGTLVAVWTFSRFFGPSPARWTLWERALALGFGLYGLGTIAWPLWFLSTAVWRDGVVSIGVEAAWLAGAGLVGVAGVFRLTSGVVDWRLRPTMAVRSRLALAGEMAPTVLVLAALAVFGVSALTRTASDPDRTVLIATSAALAALVAVRTGLSTMRSGALRAQVGIDPLTGLHSHRYFHERLDGAIHDCGGAGRSLAVAIVDLDDFAHINRVAGYREGDRILQTAARVVARALHEGEEACRLGGDEFGLILPGAQAEYAALVTGHVLDRLRTVEDTSGAPLRASAGIATCPEHARTRDELVRCVDRAMFLAKYGGKDRLVVWSQASERRVADEEIESRARQQAFLGTLRATATAIDARTPAGSNHSRNVASMALRIATRAGLPEAEVRRVETAALLHDIGKVGVPDAALVADPASMETGMRERLEEHPALGETIVATTGLADMGRWIRSHHERWDGKGYPDGLAGEDIPLEARIIGVADAYDHARAVSGRRLSRADVTEHMRAGMSGRHDPLIVLHLLSVLAAEEALAP